MSTSGPAAPRTALVTGASSGIGAATARALGALGWRVALGARREARLREVAADVERAGGRALAHVLDVTRPASLDAFCEAVEKEWGAPDAVVSNAGVGIPNLLHEAEPDELEREVATNLLGPLWLARRVIPGLAARGRGDLVFVGSSNAVQPRTFQAAYSACKAGVEVLARVLEMELEGTGVRVGVLRPGPTGSEFGANYGPAMSRRILESWKYWGIMRELHWMSAECVAQALVGMLTTPPGARLGVVEVMPESRAPRARP